MIFIDGDSCPVIEKTEAIAMKHHIECHIMCDTTRCLTSEYSTVHIIDKGRDAVDIAIANMCKEDDIVITNDIGLACMALGKKSRVVSPYGHIYTHKIIEPLLIGRHIAKSQRQNKKGCYGRLKKQPMPKNFGEKYCFSKALSITIHRIKKAQKT